MTKSNTFSPETIFETQRQFMAGWFDVTRAALQGDMPDSLSAFATSSGSDDGQAFLSRMMQATKGYFDMAEQFSTWTPQEWSSQDMSAPQACNHWAEQLHDLFSGIINAPFPGDFFRADFPEGVDPLSEGVYGTWARFLSVPSLGYTRELQEKHKKLARLILDHQKASHDYNVAIAKVGQTALQRFQKHLAQEQNGAPSTVPSFKALYDLWTQAAEEAYGAYALTEEHAVLYGSLVNKMMAVKQQAAYIVDDMFDAFNLPTRKEINTLQDRVQEMRRTYDARVTKDIQSLHDKIEMLEKEMAALKSSAAQKTVKKNSATAETKKRKGGGNDQ